MGNALTEALDTGEALASSTAPGARETKAYTDFAAFGMFKDAGIGQAIQQGAQALGPLAKPLAWGVGLGLPALGVGHALISDAHSQGDEMVKNVRNQTLLTALGVGGMKSIGDAVGSYMNPKHGMGAGPGPAYGEYKLAADADLHKLAALVLVDDVLVAQIEDPACASNVKHAALECLFINRMAGADLLRKLRR